VAEEEEAASKKADEATVASSRAAGTLLSQRGMDGQSSAEIDAYAVASRAAALTLQRVVRRSLDLSGQQQQEQQQQKRQRGSRNQPSRSYSLECREGQEEFRRSLGVLRLLHGSALIPSPSACASLRVTTDQTSTPPKNATKVPARTSPATSEEEEEEKKKEDFFGGVTRLFAGAVTTIAAAEATATRAPSSQSQSQSAEMEWTRVLPLLGRRLRAFTQAFCEECVESGRDVARMLASLDRALALLAATCSTTQKNQHVSDEDGSSGAAESGCAAEGVAVLRLIIADVRRRFPHYSQLLGGPRISPRRLPAGVHGLPQGWSYCYDASSTRRRS